MSFGSFILLLVKTLDELNKAGDCCGRFVWIGGREEALDRLNVQGVLVNITNIFEELDRTPNHILDRSKRDQASFEIALPPDNKFVFVLVS